MLEGFVSLGCGILLAMSGIDRPEKTWRVVTGVLVMYVGWFFIS